MEIHFPNSDKLMFDFEHGVANGATWVHYSKLSTCVPLNVVIGKKINDIFRKDMMKLFLFSERMMP